MLISWGQYLFTSPKTPSKVLSQCLCFNNYIKTDDAVIHFEKFSNKSFIFLSQLFGNGRITLWLNLKDEYELTNDMFFQWAKLYKQFLQDGEL